MLRFVLGKLRWLLQRADTVLTRRLFPQPCLVPPGDLRELQQWKEFFRQLGIADRAAAEYRDAHLERLARTMTIVPQPGGTGRLLELGCYMQMAPAAHFRLRYPEVRGAYLGPAGHTEVKTATLARRQTFRCEIDLFDAERDRFPYPDSQFDCVLAGEIIEHLRRDPMHMLFEIHRVLVEGGALVLTTPNAAGLGCVTRALLGVRNPQVFSCYPYPVRAPGDSPHVREYTPFELNRTLQAAGFQVELLFTDRIGAREEGSWAWELLRRGGFDRRLRGEQIYCRAIRDSSLTTTRYPEFLYAR